MLKNARHPCLETQDYVTFIPNDVEMIRGKLTNELCDKRNIKKTLFK